MTDNKETRATKAREAAVETSDSLVEAPEATQASPVRARTSQSAESVTEDLSKEDFERLQRLLNLDVTGRNNDATRAQVKFLQRIRGLEPTGEADSDFMKTPKL